MQCDVGRVRPHSCRFGHIDAILNELLGFTFALFARTHSYVCVCVREQPKPSVWSGILDHNLVFGRPCLPVGPGLSIYGTGQS